MVIECDILIENAKLSNFIENESRMINATSQPGASYHIYYSQTIYSGNFIINITDQMHIYLHIYMLLCVCLSVLVSAKMFVHVQVCITLKDREIFSAVCLKMQTI